MSLSTTASGGDTALVSNVVISRLRGGGINLLPITTAADHRGQLDAGPHGGSQQVASLSDGPAAAAASSTAIRAPCPS